MIDIFNQKGDESLGIALHPSTLVPPTGDISSATTATERHTIYREHMLYKQRKSELLSLWCSTLFTLSIANHVSSFLDLSKIVFLAIQWEPGRPCMVAHKGWRGALLTCCGYCLAKEYLLKCAYFNLFKIGESSRLVKFIYMPQRSKEEKSGDVKR